MNKDLLIDPQSHHFSIHCFVDRERKIDADLPQRDNIPQENKILSLVIRWQLAKRRSGNHSVKSRAEVKHSTRKLFSQKGRGAARVGDSGSPMRVGGGVAMGPVVRSHEHFLNKKVKKIGLFLSVLQKIRMNYAFFIDEQELSALAKTKDFVTWFEQHISEPEKKGGFIFVCKDEELIKLRLITQNITNITVLPLCGLNVYDIVKHQRIVFMKSVYQQWLMLHNIINI
jgi:large subunit ribosomal protein L4